MQTQFTRRQVVLLISAAVLITSSVWMAALTISKRAERVSEVAPTGRMYNTCDKGKAPYFVSYASAIVDAGGRSIPGFGNTVVCATQEQFFSKETTDEVANVIEAHANEQSKKMENGPTQTKIAIMNYIKMR